MKRGDLYRVYKPKHGDPRKFRVFVVVSREVLIESQFSTVICAPVYSRFDGLSTQVQIGSNQGLKHPSAIHCDELKKLAKSALTHFVGTLSPEQMVRLAEALKIALELD